MTLVRIKQIHKVGLGRRSAAIALAARCLLVPASQVDTRPVVGCHVRRGLLLSIADLGFRYDQLVLDTLWFDWANRYRICDCLVPTNASFCTSKNGLVAADGRLLIEVRRQAYLPLGSNGNHIIRSTILLLFDVRMQD